MGLWVRRAVGAVWWSGDQKPKTSKFGNLARCAQMGKRVKLGGEVMGGGCGYVGGEGEG